MNIKKGTKLKVADKRKGTFIGVAIRDFNTEKEEFYPIALDQEVLHGLSRNWLKGDEVPCRNTLCKLKTIELEEAK